MAGQR
ncbi:rCG31520 [Rattus norvegicus]